MVPFAAIMAAPLERGRAVGTVVSGIMLGLLMGRVVGGALSAAVGWRPVFGFAAAFMGARLRADGADSAATEGRRRISPTAA